MEKLQDILPKVSDLFRKYGVKSVTMDDIARELGISKKTIYLHVADKTDLISKLTGFEIERVQKCIAEMFQTKRNAIEELFEVNRFMINMLKRYSPSFEYDMKKYYPDIFRQIKLVRQTNIYNATLNNLKKGKAEGLYRKELNEEVLAKLNVSRIVDLPNNSMFTSEELNSGNIFKELFIYHIRGIANKNGIKFLEENINKLDYSDTEIL